MTYTAYKDIFGSPVDLIRFKECFVDAGHARPSWGRRDDITEHIAMLEKEFHGKTLLEFYFVWLTVHIRRNINLESNISNFFKLWKEESDFLIAKLSSRWLVSACDTYIDISDNPLEVSYAIGATSFANTVKIYETHLLSIDTNHAIEPINTYTPLFDGMTAYCAQGGDMLYNLLKRIYHKVDTSIVTGKILKELWQRLLTHHTLLHTMAAHNQSYRFSEFTDE